MIIKRGLPLLLGLALLGSPALPVFAADATQIKVGDKLPRANLLTPGTHRYLRYKVKDGERHPIDIWSRTLSYETKDGKRLFHISQRWDEVGPPVFFLEQDSWFEADTFRPITHLRRGNKGGEVKIKAYRFERDAVVGRADVEGNVDKDYRKATPEPVFNFETDMEMLQALPLAEGYAANLPFMDAGIDEPGRYVFKVAGSDRIKEADGRNVECWLVTADYNTGTVRAKFWFAKETQVMLREEVDLGEGETLIKSLIASESTDQPA
jgi:hypothetical protein